MRCPVCRAENVDAVCRRCKADLSLLAGLEESRRGELARSASAIAAGDGQGALRHAEAAHHLMRDAESWRRLAVARLLLRDFAGASACRAGAR